MKTDLIEYKDLGLIDYNKALLFQEQLVEQRFLNQIPDTVLFCNHPSVVTLGRSTQPGDVAGWQGQIVEVSRGGRATYHGPGQRVIYPILDLRQDGRTCVRPKDIMSYLENFEQAVLDSLFEVGITNAKLKEDIVFDENGKKLLNRGIWVEDRKIAAFGIAVRKWISYHGCAINIFKDENSFVGIQPCGYQQNAVGYLQDFVETKDLALDDVLKKNLTMRFAWTI